MDGISIKNSLNIVPSFNFRPLLSGVKEVSKIALTVVGKGAAGLGMGTGVVAALGGFGLGFIQTIGTKGAGFAAATLPIKIAVFSPAVAVAFVVLALVFQPKGLEHKEIEYVNTVAAIGVFIVGAPIFALSLTYALPGAGAFYLSYKAWEHLKFERDSFGTRPFADF